MRRRNEISGMLKVLLVGSALVAAVARCSYAQEQESQGTVDRARSLANSGQRTQALSLLQQRLEQMPADTDARVLYGIVSSWEGNYDVARTQLQQVLTNNADHADALPALINVELWSGHPERAEQLAREGAQRQGDSTTLLLGQARALQALDRGREAMQILDRVLRLDPANAQAREMREGITEASRRWELGANYYYEWFSDGRDPWHESSLSLKRYTDVGSVLFRFSRADRFSTHSNQAEIEAYPSLRPGTYAYLNVGYSPDADLYPRYRAGADLFQMLGKGVEGSVGYRRLAFGDGVDIYTGALAKYHRNWLFTGRAFVTPSTLGVSHTVLVSARYFLSDNALYDYLEVRYGRGSFPDEFRTTQQIEILRHSSFRAELTKLLGRRWSITLSFGASREDRIARGELWQYLSRGAVYFLF